MFLALTQDIPLDHVVPLVQYNKNVSIVNANKFYLVSNVCPHQSSRITKCATQELKCPYHGLRFDLAGNGIDNPNKLERWDCHTNQTILFDQHVMCEFPAPTEHMTLVEHREDIVRADPNAIMDVFLDIEHIPVAHPGVYDEIGMSDFSMLKYTTFDNGSLQLVPIAGTRHIHQDDLKYGLGAAWMAVYPGTMIEWQPGALFVTVALPHEQGSSVQVYKYRDSRYSDSAWELNSRVWETAWEQDRDLSEGIVMVPVDNLDDLKQHHRVWMQDAV